MSESPADTATDALPPLAPNPYQRTLTLLADAIDDKDRALIEGLLLNPEGVSAIASLDMMAALDLLRPAQTIRGLKRKIDGVLRDAALERLISASSVDSPRAIEDALARAPGLPEYTAKLRIPYGYEIDETGVTRTNELTGARVNVLPRPLFVGARSVDADTGAIEVELWWTDRRNRWVKHYADRAVVADPKLIVSLSSYGAPVDGVAPREAVKWLSRFQEVNVNSLTSVRVVRRLGWVKVPHQPPVYVLPDVTIGVTDEVVHFVPQPGYRPMTDALHVRGDGEVMRRLLIDDLADYPFPHVAVWAAAASPLLSIVDCKGFMLDISGPTTTGKTTSMGLGMAVNGNGSSSSEYLASWEETYVWIERARGILHHLPFFIDERALAKSTQHVSDIVFSQWQGRGRGRGRADEGARVTATWHSVMMGTGEYQLVKDSNVGGLGARVLTLHGWTLKDRSAKHKQLARKITRVASSHYGHIGRDMAAYLVAIHDDWDVLRDQYEMILDQLTARTRANAVSSRLLDYVAAIALSGHILTHLGWTKPTCDPIGALLDSTLNVLASDKAYEAAVEVAGWLVKKRSRFVSQGMAFPDRSQDFYGLWAPGTNWEYCAVIAVELHSIMKAMGYRDCEVLIAQWADAGWIESRSVGTPPCRSLLFRESVAGASVGCYHIKRDFFDAAAGNAYD